MLITVSRVLRFGVFAKALFFDAVFLVKLQTTVFNRFILLAVPGSPDRPQGQVLQKLPQTMNYYDIL
jgi:hypothetical protein